MVIDGYLWLLMVIVVVDVLYLANCGTYYNGYQWLLMVIIVVDVQ